MKLNEPVTKWKKKKKKKTNLDHKENSITTTQFKIQHKLEKTTYNYTCSTTEETRVQFLSALTLCRVRASSLSQSENLLLNPLNTKKYRASGDCFSVKLELKKTSGNLKETLRINTRKKGS